MSKKIIHIVGDSSYGGGSVLVEKFCLFANKEGFESTVLTTNHEFIDVLSEKGIRVENSIKIKREINLLNDFFTTCKLFLFLKKNKFDIVQTHTSKGGVIGRLAAKLAKVDLIIHTVHGYAFHDNSSQLAKAIYVNIERFCARFCHKIVSVSNYHREVTLNERIANDDKVIAIQNGISRAEFQSKSDNLSIREEYKIPEHVRLFCSVGRLSEQKGFKYLIDAVQILVDQKVLNFKVLIIGDGEKKVELQDQITNHGLNEYISLVGFKRNVYDYVSQADVYILPSLWEGLSISLIEAMSASTPILCSDIKPNLEVLNVKNNIGCSFISKNSESLSVKMKSFIDDEYDVVHFKENSKIAFDECFDENVMLNKYLSLYAGKLK